DIFPLKPREIIAHVNLLRPIYRETAHDGHFGRRGRNFTWERTDMVKPLRKAMGL
ncbi:unnamed protein product, partial [marine sediment metagenome]